VLLEEVQKRISSNCPRLVALGRVFVPAVLFNVECRLHVLAGRTSMTSDSRRPSNRSVESRRSARRPETREAFLRRCLTRFLRSVEAEGFGEAVVKAIAPRVPQVRDAWGICCPCQYLLLSGPRSCEDPISDACRLAD
jgi:hypothetical protein